MNTDKYLIGIDIDQVLLEASKGWAKFSNREYGMDLKAANFSEDWQEVWEVDYDEACRRSKSYHKSDEFKYMPPMPLANRVIGSLALRYELVAISTRSEHLMPDTESQLEKHFSGIFSRQTIKLIGQWEDTDSKTALEITKTDTLRELGVDLLIDDQPKHILCAKDSGLGAVLFGEYSYNTQPDHENFTRAPYWLAVPRAVEYELNKLHELTDI